MLWELKTDIKTPNSQFLEINVRPLNPRKVGNVPLFIICYHDHTASAGGEKNAEALKSEISLTVAWT